MKITLVCRSFVFFCSLKSILVHCSIYVNIFLVAKDCIFIIGASISQLTDPFSLTPTERVGGSQTENEDSGDEGRAGSFLITSVDIDTGQPSFSHDTDFNSSIQQKQKHFHNRQSFSATNVDSMSTFKSRLRSFSDTNQPGASSSLPRSAQQFGSTVPILDEKMDSGAKDTVINKDDITGNKPTSRRGSHFKNSGDGKTKESTVSNVFLE